MQIDTTASYESEQSSWSLWCKMLVAQLSWRGEPLHSFQDVPKPVPSPAGSACGSGTCLLGGTCADFLEWFAEVWKRHKGFHHSYPELFPMHKHHMQWDPASCCATACCSSCASPHKGSEVAAREGVTFQLASRVCTVVQSQGKVKCRSPYVDTVVLFTLMRSHPSLQKDGCQPWPCLRKGHATWQAQAELSGAHVHSRKEKEKSGASFHSVL